MSILIGKLHRNAHITDVSVLETHLTTKIYFNFFFFSNLDIKRRNMYSLPLLEFSLLTVMFWCWGENEKY